MRQIKSIRHRTSVGIVLGLIGIFALSTSVYAETWDWKWPSRSFTPKEQIFVDKVYQVALQNKGTWSIEEAGKPYSGVTITVAADASTEADAPQLYDKEFLEKTGIKVIWEQNPFQEHKTKFYMDFAAGTGRYDLVWVPFDDIAAVTAKKYVQPINRFLTDPKLLDPEIDLGDYSQKLWKNTSWFGDAVFKHVYGFPCEYPTRILWYRKDLLNNDTEKKNFLKKYGYELAPPTSFLQLYNMAEFFTRDKGEKLAGETLKGKFYGIGISGKRHWAVIGEWLEYSQSYGGGPWAGTVDDNNDIIVNRPENVESLKAWVSLFRFAPPGCVDWYWDLKTTAFQKRKVAMALAWNDQAYEVENPKDSSVAGKMGYAINPSKKFKMSHFGPWSWTVSAKSKNPEAAYLYMQWVRSKNIALKCALEGAMPSRYSVYANPEVQKIPFMKATMEALPHAMTGPVHLPEWGAMCQELQLYLTKAHRQEMTPKEALDTIAIKWKDILKTNLVYPVDAAN